MRHLELNRETFLSRVKETIQREAIGNASGLVAEMAQYQLSTSGKQLRIQMIYELALSLKVNLEKVVPWAACCELLHTASIIQDDLQDKDVFRRERETIWHKFGKEQAINLNIFFLELSRLVLLNSELDTATVRRLLSIASNTTIRLVQGQSDEIEASGKPVSEVSIQDYCAWVDSKTASLFLAALDGVMAFNEKETLHAESLRQVIRALGNAFQFADDVLDLFGEKGRKEPGCDIKEGKLSFLVLEYQLNYPNDCNILNSILKKPRESTTADDIAYCKDLFLSTSIPQICARKISTYIAQAMHRFRSNLTPEFVECASRIQHQITAPIDHLNSSANLGEAFVSDTDLSLIITEKLRKPDSTGFRPQANC